MEGSNWSVHYFCHQCINSQTMCFSRRHDNLEVVKGDACDVESFASVMEGKDAVLSSLGSSTYVSVFSSTTFYSESIKAITEAMKRCVLHSFGFNISSSSSSSSLSSSILSSHLLE